MKGWVGQYFVTLFSALQIVVSDEGIPAMSSTAVVLITLTNSTAAAAVNQSASFPRASYQLSIAENRPAGSGVGVVSASPGGPPVIYTLVTPSEYFYIVNDTGEILTRFLFNCFCYFLL